MTPCHRHIFRSRFFLPNCLTLSSDVVFCRGIQIVRYSHAFLSHWCTHPPCSLLCFSLQSCHGIQIVRYSHAFPSLWCTHPPCSLLCFSLQSCRQTDIFPPIKLSFSSHKGSFYIAQYPVRWTAQRALHFCLPWQTCSFRHQLGFSGKHSSQAAITRQGLITHIATTVYSQVLIYTAE